MDETFNNAKWSEPGRIASVSSGERGYEIYLEDGCVFFLESKYGIEPKVGDTLRIANKFGSTSIGNDINGVKIGEFIAFRNSDQKIEADRQKWLKDKAEEKKTLFLKNEANLNEDFNSLPMPFQDRIARFRLKNPNFRVEYEGYEMAVCVDAARIAKLFKTIEGIDTFRKMSFEEREAAFPDMLSGSTNQYEYVLILAKVYLNSPRLLKYHHGAIANLVGCDTFGCHPLTEDEKADSEALIKEYGL